MPPTTEPSASRPDPDPVRAGPIPPAGLTRLVYDELRALAAAYLRHERPGHTLQPTALVHEAYLRLFDSASPQSMNRTQFFAASANVMRRVLVEHARARGAQKRGGQLRRLPLEPDLALAADAHDELLALDDALSQLAALDQRQARVVELRFFGGLTVDEVAESLGYSKRAIESDWQLARAWLHRALSPQDESAP
ncbi:MAG: sigma-70 family RNA polymerase sigma factor [Phycisphaerae bacterium]